MLTAGAMGHGLGRPVERLGVNWGFQQGRGGRRRVSVCCTSAFPLHSVFNEGLAGCFPTLLHESGGF